MRFPNYSGRVHECMGAYFMVIPIDEADPMPGDLVRVEIVSCTYDDSIVASHPAMWQWFVVGEHHEEEGIEWWSVRPASFWERLFGGRRGARQHQAH